jgi:hypothetical protein
MENLSLKWNRSWLKLLTGTDCSLKSSVLDTPSPPLNQQKTFRTTASWINGKCSQLLTATNIPRYFQLDLEEVMKNSSQDANYLTKTREGGNVRGKTSVGLSGYTLVHRNIIELHGTLQNPMEPHEIPWKVLEHGGIFWLLTNDYK